MIIFLYHICMEGSMTEREEHGMDSGDPRF